MAGLSCEMRERSRHDFGKGVGICLPANSNSQYINNFRMFVK